MKTRILCLIGLFTFVSSAIFAQQETPVRYHQLGVNFNSLNSFGIHYKTGGEKTMLRLTLLTLNLSNNSRYGRPEDSIDVKSQSYGAGFRIGFEKHVPIVAKFNFIWGLEAGCTYNYQKQNRDNSYQYSDYEITGWEVTPSVNLVLGATYTIKDRLVLGIEINPYLQYSFGKNTNIYPSRTTEETTSSFGFGFSNNSANLTVAYRFGK